MYNPEIHHTRRPSRRSKRRLLRAVRAQGIPGATGHSLLALGTGLKASGSSTPLTKSSKLAKPPCKL